jgi:hypothetical protein
MTTVRLRRDSPTVATIVNAAELSEMAYKRAKMAFDMARAEGRTSAHEINALACRVPPTISLSAEDVALARAQSIDESELLVSKALDIVGRSFSAAEEFGSTSSTQELLIGWNA